MKPWFILYTYSIGSIEEKVGDGWLTSTMITFHKLCIFQNLCPLHDVPWHLFICAIYLWLSYNVVWFDLCYANQARICQPWLICNECAHIASYGLSRVNYEHVLLVFLYCFCIFYLVRWLIYKNILYCVVWCGMVWYGMAIALHCIAL